MESLYLFTFLRTFFVLSIFHLVVFSSKHPLCHEDESSALLQFKESFVIDESASRGDASAYPKVLSWKLKGENSSDCCSWDGIECDEDTGHVIALDLSSSCLFGSINSNSSLFRLSHLQSVNLAYNHFNHSQIPTKFGHLSGLKYLNLSMSAFHGQIPSEISRLSKLATLDLSFNLLFGEIPQPICNLSFLYSLYLSYNDLSGNLSPFLGCLSNSLSILNLRGNKFNGAIDPLSFSEGSSLRTIDLGENEIQGKMPGSLANCSMLESLDLDNNQISDTFPFWLGSLTELKVLVLRSNRFHGAIRSAANDSMFPKLSIIDLSYNDFTGNLPFEYFPNLNSRKTLSNYSRTNSSYLLLLICSWKQQQHYLDYSPCDSITFANKSMKTIYGKILDIFTAIDFSSNNFSGEIPESIGNLKGLFVLNLSNNGLTGRIPSVLGNLTYLESVDLSHNKISGEIPQQLTQLTFLSFFNVSNNHLSGPIPQGKQFDTFENSSFLGNSELCGDPLTTKCNELSPAPPIDYDLSKDSAFLSRTEWIVIMMGYGSGVIVGLVAGNMVTTWKHKWFVETFGKRQLKLRGKKRVRRN